jgi:hypothetical protein
MWEAVRYGDVDYYDGKFRSFGGGDGDAAPVERKRRRRSTARSVMAALL